MKAVSSQTYRINSRRANQQSQPPMTTTKEPFLFTHDNNAPRVRMSSQDAYHDSICSAPPPSRSMVIPPPIEAQSTTIYDFFRNDLVTPWSVVPVMQAVPAPVDPSTCQIFDLFEVDKELSSANSTIKLPAANQNDRNTHVPTFTAQMQPTDVGSRQTPSEFSPLSPTAPPFVPCGSFQATPSPDMNIDPNLFTSDAKDLADAEYSLSPCNGSSPSHSSRQPSPVPSLGSSEGTEPTLQPTTPMWPTFEESDHNINHKPDDIEARLTALGLKFTVDSDCDSDDDGEQLQVPWVGSRNFGQFELPDNEATSLEAEEDFEIVKLDAQGQQPPLDDDSSVQLVTNVTAPAATSIHTFNVSKMGAWADMDDEDEGFEKFATTLDTIATSEESEHMQDDLSTPVPVSPTESLIPGNQPSPSPLSQPGSLESAVLVFEPSAQNTFLSYGNRSLEFYEPELGIEERVEKLCELGERTYEERDLASNPQEARRLKQAEERARKNEVCDVYDRHYDNTPWNDDEDGFNVGELAVRQAELYIDTCPYGELPTSTMMTPFEYTYITAPQTVCADFAAMYLVNDNEGVDYYAVRAYDDHKPDLCGIYHHPFSQEFRDMLADQYDEEGNLQAPIVRAVESSHDINRRFCLLRSLILNAHPFIWHGKMIEERIAASKELGESNLRLMKAPIVYGEQVKDVKATGLSYRIGYRKRPGFRELRTKLIDGKENGWQTYPEAIKETIGCTPLRQVQTHSSTPLNAFEQPESSPWLAGADDNTQVDDTALPYEEILKESVGYDNDNGTEEEHARSPPTSPKLPETPRVGLPPRPNAPTPLHATHNPLDELIFTPTPRRPRAFLGLGPFDPSPVGDSDTGLPAIEENGTEGDALKSTEPTGDGNIFDFGQVMNYPEALALGFDLTKLDEDDIFSLGASHPSHDEAEDAIVTAVLNDFLAYVDADNRNGNAPAFDDDSKFDPAPDNLGELFMGTISERIVGTANASNVAVRDDSITTIEQIQLESSVQFNQPAERDVAEAVANDHNMSSDSGESPSIPSSWIDEDDFVHGTQMETSTSALDSAFPQASSILYMAGIALVALALW